MKLRSKLSLTKPELTSKNLTDLLRALNSTLKTGEMKSGRRFRTLLSTDLLLTLELMYKALEILVRKYLPFPREKSSTTILIRFLKTD
jgi:hypothetical protein|tara:strand:- start:119 stop:382 length:264 start_codon:yes stop_codon:yes gene_type:complete